jgi:hypothetical protein
MHYRALGPVEAQQLHDTMQRGIRNATTFIATFGPPEMEPLRESALSGVIDRWPVMLTEGNGLNATYV